MEVLMNKGFIYVLLLLIAVVNFCQSSKAVSLAASDVNKPKIQKHDFKHPTDWLELGGDFRFRYIYDNNRKLDNHAVGHDRSQMRLRARTSAKFKLTDDIDFNLRILTEPRYYIEAASEPKHLAYQEALFDNFNLTMRNAFDMPLTIVAGRQDIILGNGWLFADGTPLDGSRSSYFDALRFVYDFDKDTTMNLIWVQDYADSAKYMKPFNDRDIDLSEQDEQGAIFHLNRKTGKDAGIDGYVIYKHDTNRNVSSGSEGEIYTIGARKYGRLNDNWEYSTEIAPQFGHKNGKGLHALGSNNQLIYSFKDEHKNKLYFGYEYLSGSGDADKNFDRGWARMDTWSVLYQGDIDSIDGRKYDASNLHRLYAQWETNFTDKLSLRTDYNILFADENLTNAASKGLSRTGNFRGQLIKTTFKYKMTKAIEHRLEGEVFLPGNFYSEARNDVAVLARYSLYYTW
jgi:hypothetical protein